jgi:hypothetical protein
MACIVIAGPALGATNSYDGTYFGEQSLTNGAAPLCAGRESVTVIINGSRLKFISRELRDFPMRFDPRRDGSFAATIEDPGGYPLQVRGIATETAIDLDLFNYGNGCEHHWHLEKKL